jgi:hypothetical protein
MSTPMILQLPNEVLRLIADFIISQEVFDELFCSMQQRSKILELHGPIVALFGAEPILHISRRTTSSMLQLHWRFNEYGVYEVDADGVKLLDYDGLPTYVDWWEELKWELYKQTRARIDHEYGGFLLPYTQIMRARCMLQDAIREELKVVEERLIVIPYLHLHELPSVQSNCVLYTAMHDTQ